MKGNSYEDNRQFALAHYSAGEFEQLQHNRPYTCDAHDRGNDDQTE